MKNLFKSIGAIAIPLFILVSCDQEDPPLPTPMADFETDPEIVEVTVPVKFENLSINAARYEWDFGDGQTSEEISPTTTYEETGTYTVILKAFTEDNQVDSLSQDIAVGERVLTGLNINSFSFVNPDGEDWDEVVDGQDSTKYPDFILFIGPEDNPNQGIATPLLEDLAPFELPIGFQINPGNDPFILTNETWELSFIDFDGEDLNNAQNEDFQVMNVVTFNPVLIPTSTVDENGEGFIQVSLGLYSVDLFFLIE